MLLILCCFFLFFFKDTATTEIYTYGHTLSLHDALPISSTSAAGQMVLGVPITESDSVSVLFGSDRNEINTFRGYTPDSIVDYSDALDTKPTHAWRRELDRARDTRTDFRQPPRETKQRVQAESERKRRRKGRVAARRSTHRDTAEIKR